MLMRSDSIVKRYAPQALRAGFLGFVMLYLYIIFRSDPGAAHVGHPPA
jgi:hypothetical protein